MIPLLVFGLSIDNACHGLANQWPDRVGIDFIALFAEMQVIRIWEQHALHRLAWETCERGSNVAETYRPLFRDFLDDRAVSLVGIFVALPAGHQAKAQRRMIVCQHDALRTEPRRAVDHFDEISAKGRC